MNGQWVGSYYNNGAIIGTIVFDLDDMGTHFEGYAYVFPENQLEPRVAFFIKTNDKKRKFELSLKPLPIHPDTGFFVPWEQIAQRFPNTALPSLIKAKFSYSNKSMKIEWQSDKNTNGNVSLEKRQGKGTTEYVPLEDVKDWVSFKTFVNSSSCNGCIYRGQAQTQRLRTSFHRTERANLERFLQDIRVLHRHLSSRTNHIFNLDNADENGAFFNLVQHHGFPTPLLDWTYSPFVSAFFAYHKINNHEAEKRSNKNKKVRIFIFDQAKWRGDYNQVSMLTRIPLHFSIMEFIAINNERMIPQQAISSVTNIDDVERYILECEKRQNTQYLRIVDLPVSERPRVMTELRLMGITAGSLFPGLDGACEELKEKLFSI